MKSIVSVYLDRPEIREDQYWFARYHNTLVRIVKVREFFIEFKSGMITTQYTKDQFYTYYVRREEDANWYKG